MTTPFGPFLDPPDAIVKENFVILNAMHQKNEFGELPVLSGVSLCIRLPVPDLRELRLGQVRN